MVKFWAILRVQQKVCLCFYIMFFFSFFVVLLGFLLLYFMISVNKFVLSLLYFRKSVLFFSQ